MKKTIFITTIIMILCALLINAERYTTDVKLKVENTTITVEGENNVKMTQTFNYNNNISNTMTIDIYRNTTCATTSTLVNTTYIDFLQRNCDTIMSNLTQSSSKILTTLEGTISYFPKYADCSVNLTKCTSKIEDYDSMKTSKENCNIDYEKLQTDYNSVRNQYSVCNSELDKCKKDNTNSFQNSIIAFIIGAVIVFAYFKYEERKKKGNSPLENVPGGIII